MNTVLLPILNHSMMYCSNYYQKAVQYGDTLHPNNSKMNEDIQV